MDLQSETNYWLAIQRENPRRFSQIIRDKHKEFYDLITSISFGKTFSEKLYNYIHKTNGKICEHCNKNNVAFLDFSRGYGKFCSTKCLTQSAYCANIRKENCIKKYGVEHYSQTDDYKEKFKKTLMSKYGVINPGQIEVLKSKRSRTKQKTFFDKLLDETTNYAIPLFSFNDYKVVREKYPWKCIKCEETFESHVFNKIPKCPVCFPTAQYGGQSLIEKEIVEFIRKFYDGNLIENTRGIIPPKELDIFIPDLNLAIEVCGFYWHSDMNQKNIYYHQQKQQACESLGIKLLTILDYEWANKREICENILKYNIKKETRNISARTCIIREIPSKVAREFVDKYHIQQFQRGTFHYGMFHASELVSVMSLGKDRFNKKSNSLEIIRFCSSCNVRGSFSKFLSFIKKTYNRKIVSFVDLRWGNGKSYSLAGFELVSTSKPGYWYYLNGKMYHRLSWSKKKLIKMGHDPNLTEFEIMESLGALRFWDCGVKKYEF